MPRPNKPLLSSDAILDTAIKILNTKGESGLTIRGIAKVMNVNPNAIYYYFANLDKLLEATVERIFEGLKVSSSEKGWRKYLMDTAFAYRALFLAHPNATMLILSRQRQNQAYVVLEKTMGVMETAGFSPAEARAIHEQIASMVIGFSLVELSADKSEEALIRDQYPKMALAFKETERWSPTRRLSFALTFLIDGLDALLAART